MLRHAVDPAKRLFRAWRLVGLTSLALAAGALPAGADSARIGVSAYLREGPGMNYRPVDEASAGREADIVECGGEWCRIRLGDLEGYVPQSVLASGPALPSAAAGQTCFVNQQAGYHGTRDLLLCHAASDGP